MRTRNHARALLVAAAAITVHADESQPSQGSRAPPVQEVSNESPPLFATLERLRFERGLPQRIYRDNGTEFVSAAMDLWVDQLTELSGG